MRVPEEIVYLPEGEHLIHPKSHPDGILVKVPAERGEEIAASFQAELERLMALNVRPRFDFRHEADGPTAGYPRSFRYEAGRGLICAVDWSGAGRAAIEGRDFAYFSPRFDLDDEGMPAGLPQRGPLGALVNEPAFREIERIAASDAGDSNKPTKDIRMSHTILATCGLLTETEAAGEDAAELARKRVAELEETIAKLTRERDKLKAEAAKSATEASAAREERAQGLVEAAVADGRIAPRDEETQRGFRERITAGDAFAEKMLSTLPRQHAGLERPLIAGGAARRGAEQYQGLKGGELLEAALAEEVGSAK